MLDATHGSIAAPTRARRARPPLLVAAALALAVSLSPASPGGAAARFPRAAELATATTGPGRAEAAFRRAGDSFAVRIQPNRASAWNTITVAVTHVGLPLRRADITISFTMPAMAMGTETFRLDERSPGLYSYLGPALMMPGRWDLTFTVGTRVARPFTAVVVDHLAR
jgi:YtkA-like